ncbi:MAG TPA: carbohydrate-binding protein [Phycisphaerae bacterium]|nr:carbohydrate-binding protein [Phycisphaerae bacterium]HRR86518.1 carbohydrate-binding protein [Phycisphaerae bacterium]
MKRNMIKSTFWTVGVMVAALGVFGQNLLAGTPYPGPASHPIPGVIEAENYDADGANVSYFDTTAGNSGSTYRADDVDIQIASGGSDVEGTVVYNVASTEWMEYTVEVASAGTYKLVMRCAVNTSGTQVQFKLDGNAITPVTTLLSGGAWNRWDEMAWTVSLPAGQHVLRFEMVAGSASEGVKINWFSFTPYVETFDRPGLAFWRFDNDGGGPTVLDQTANGNNGTATNVAYSALIPPVAWPTIPYPGATTPTPPAAPNDAPAPNWPAHGAPRNATSADFERDMGAYITVADSETLDRGADKSWTVEAWVKLETAGDIGNSTTRQWLIHKKAFMTSDNFTDYAVLVNGADYVNNATWINPEPDWPNYAGLTGKEIVVLFGRADGSGTDRVVSRLQVYDPAASGGALWHHVTVSYNAVKKEVIFVVDNLPPERVTGLSPTNVPNNGPLVIGGHIMGNANSVNQTFDGQIDELWIAPEPLAGTPGNTGAPLFVPWFWENEGVAMDGTFTTEDKAPWKERPSKMSEDNSCFWQVETDPADSANAILHLFDDANLAAYYFWDHDTFNKVDSAAYKKETCTPQNMSQGLAWTCRFKLTRHMRNELGSPTQSQKFLRFVSDLQGATGANAHFGITVQHTNETTRTGISVRDDAGGTGWVSGDITNEWHVLHGAAWVLADNEVQHKLWLDGTEVASWVRTSRQTTFDPYIGFNDNNRRFMSEGYIDYVKMTGAGGAWAPDGTRLGTWLEICDNGVDDDGDTLADCADPDCLGWRAEVCTNGIDDDCDGYTDCADSDCVNNPVCCTHDPAFDIDDDGDVDQADFAVFQACFMTDWATMSADCRCMESDGDNDIDQTEYDAFEACASGAGISANPACDDPL